MYSESGLQGDFNAFLSACKRTQTCTQNTQRRCTAPRPRPCNTAEYLQLGPCRQDYLHKVRPAVLPASLSSFPSLRSASFGPSLQQQSRWGPSWMREKEKKRRRWEIYLSGLSGAMEKQMLDVRDDT